MAAQLRSVTGTLADRPRKDYERERRVAFSLGDVPSNQLACRVKHKWPSDELETGKAMPRGLRAVPSEDAGDRRRGVYMIRDTCPRCGKTRWQLTLPNRVLDPGAGWHYDEPRDWVKLEAEVTKRDIRAENFRRNADRIFR